MWSACGITTFRGHVYHKSKLGLKSSATRKQLQLNGVLSGKASENLQKFDMKEPTMSNFYGRHLPKYLTIQDNKVMCKHLHLILNKNPPFTVV